MNNYLIDSDLMVLILRSFSNGMNLIFLTLFFYLFECTKH